jgi:sporulation protein YlmC with PRC-barrel domain
MRRPRYIGAVVRKEGGIMLRKATKLEGYALHARDGVIGDVKDFYFDDQHWHIRYLVVWTGSWLKGRNVLISPEVVRAPDSDEKAFPVDLTMDQVRNSPGIETDLPVSRQYEAELRRHYGWLPYWGVGFPEGGMPPPVSGLVAPPTRERERTDGDRPLELRGDPHLRSVNGTKGFDIEALDGAIGHVEDFLIDGKVSRIWYLVIATRNWWPGKKVIVPPAWIQSVGWDKSHVVVDLARDAIKASPEYDPGAPWDPEYARRLHEHYRRPPYPDWDSFTPEGIVKEEDNRNRP